MKRVDLSDVMSAETVFLNVSALDDSDLIRTVVAKLNGIAGVLDADELAEAAVRRERELATGLEGGIAMPHARTKAVDRLIVSFVRPETPLNFASSDGSSSDLILFSAVPENCIDQYLYVTAQMIRKLGKEDIKSKLRSAASPEEVLQLLDI